MPRMADNWLHIYIFSYDTHLTVPSDCSHPIHCTFKVLHKVMGPLSRFEQVFEEILSNRKTDGNFEEN